MTPSRDHIGRRVRWHTPVQSGTGTLLDVDFDDSPYPHLVKADEFISTLFVNSYELMERTIDDVQKGDVLLTATKYAKVWEVLGDLVFLTWVCEFEEVNTELHVQVHSKAHLKSEGFTLVGSTIEEEQKDKEAIERLEKRGKVKDGKVIV